MRSGNTSPIPLDDRPRGDVVNRKVEAMSQTDAGWGAGPSGRYESLAERFRPVFAKIRATAVERDRERRLPHAEIGWLREANFTTLRLAPDAGATAPACRNCSPC